MIEEKVINWLSDLLDVPVSAEEPEQKPEQYVVVTKTGSGGDERVRTATLAVQSYAPTLYQAAVLNGMVISAMERIIERDDVARCRRNSDYNYTDTKKKKYRYQAVFDITYY